MLDQISVRIVPGNAIGIDSFTETVLEIRRAAPLCVQHVITLGQGTPITRIVFAGVAVFGIGEDVPAYKLIHEAHVASRKNALEAIFCHGDIFAGHALGCSRGAAGAAIAVIGQLVVVLRHILGVVVHIAGDGAVQVGLLGALRVGVPTIKRVRHAILHDGWIHRRLNKIPLRRPIFYSTGIGFLHGERAVAWHLDAPCYRPLVFIIDDDLTVIVERGCAAGNRGIVVVVVAGIGTVGTHQAEPVNCVVTLLVLVSAARRSILIGLAIRTLDVRIGARERN